MSDQILEIGRGALETSDAKVKAMMNNIVNAQTPGFKRTDISIKSFPAALENANRALGAKFQTGTMIPQVGGAYRSQASGPLFKTGGATDLAIGGNGYFALQGSGQELYTRDGRFHLDPDGRLVSASGNLPVLGQNGPIMVIPGSRLEIAKGGSVLVDGTEVDRIRLVLFDDPQELESINNSLFKIPDGKDISYKEEENPRVVQGFVESSNVSIMDEMMNMTYLSRVYDVATKIVQTRDASMSKALEMGRPAQ